MSDAKNSYDRGNEYPYDNGEVPSDGNTSWDVKAARGVMAELSDRFGGMDDVDDDIRNEVIDAVAGIIKYAHSQILVK